MGLEDFPCEVLELIFGYLGIPDRLSASSVCKRWYYASLNINFWKDAAICINTEKAAEGVHVFMNSERPFSCVMFEENCNDAFPECSSWFLCVVEMCKVIGPRLSALVFKNCTLSEYNFTDILVECPNLQHLSVINCRNLFSSAVLVRPEKVNQLKLSLQNVKELDLSCNQNLNDMYFTQLAQLFTNVKSLSLVDCPINFHPFIFRRFYPRETKPSYSILTFPWIKEFICNNATTMTSINFSRTDIDNRALKILAHVEGLQLESISLSQCQLLTSSGIKDFCHCQKKLKKLELPGSLLLDQVLPEICTNLVELRELSVVGNHWPPEQVPLLLSLQTHALSKLVKLDLNGCSDIIVLKFIDSLRNEAYPRLRHLSLRKNKVDDYVFIYVVPYMLRITYLDLSATQITDKSLVLISIHLVHLRVLLLAQCKAITDQGLTGNFETHPLLLNPCIPEDSALHDADEMRFGNCQFLKWLVFEDDHCVSLSNLKGLKELNIYDIGGISDGGIKIALVFNELKVLSLGGCSSITDEGLVAIGQNNRSLEVLSLKHSPHVTENGIAMILSYLPRLKLLDLEGCKNLTDNVICDLVKAYSFKLKYLL